jgi:hypothetical protein
MKFTPSSSPSTIMEIPGYVARIGTAMMILTMADASMRDQPGTGRIAKEKNSSKAP